MAQDLGKALEQIGDAAVAGDDWTPGLDSFAQSLNATGLVLMPANPSEVPHALKQSRSLQEPTEQYLREGWFERDERSRRAWPKAHQQKVLFEQDLTTAEERASHPFYQDFLFKHDLEWCMLSACQADVAWAVSVQRRSHEQAFGARDAEQLELCTSHISTFLRLASELSAARLQDMLEAYDIIGRAVVLLGAHRRVLGMTKAAEGEIKDVITFRSGRLFAVDKTSDTRLQTLLHGVTSSEQLNNLYGRVAVRAPDASVRIVEALPLPNNAAGPRARAMLTISNPYKTRAPDSSLLVDAFRLTPAQVRLAEALLGGGSTKEIAGRLSLSHETVRDQLRRIFEKTGTHRQADLLRLLERFAREG